MKVFATILAVGSGAVVTGAYFLFPDTKVVVNQEASAIVVEDIHKEELLNIETQIEPEVAEEKFLVTHVSTPEHVKSIYMSSWVAGTPSFRSKLVKIAEETEINAIVIDIKDYTGKVSFHIPGSIFEELGSTENRISDIKEYIEENYDILYEEIMEDGV